MSPVPQQFDNVTVLCQANVYFDGRVVSHSVLFADRSKKTLGLIYPGSYRFDTAAPELMEIVAGACRVRIAGNQEWTIHAAGSAFRVPASSFFEIAVDEGIAQYVCSFE
jgi:uncharacterized protein YaiE (UPF0345 family)